MASASQPGSQARAEGRAGLNCAHQSRTTTAAAHTAIPSLAPAQLPRTLTLLRIMAEISPPSGLRSSTRRRVHSMPCGQESKGLWA